MTGAAQGRAAKVPVMIGTTADEFNLFTALQFVRGRPIDAAHYPELLDQAFGAECGGGRRSSIRRSASAAVCRWRIRPR